MSLAKEMTKPKEEVVQKEEMVQLVLVFETDSKQFHVFDPVCCAWGPCAHQGYMDKASSIKVISPPEGFTPEEESTPYYRAMGILKCGPKMEKGKRAFSVCVLQNLPSKDRAWEERSWLSLLYSTGEAGPLNLARLFA